MMLRYDVDDIVEEIEEIKKLAMKQLDGETIMNMDTDSIALMRKLLGLTIILENVAKKSAKKIDDMDDKLDRIIREVEKK